MVAEKIQVLRQRVLATPQEATRDLEKISKLLSWTQNNLPSAPPPIISQAAYLAAVQTVEGSPMSLKALISSLGCSEAGLRKPLQQLLDGGWVVIVQDAVDQRVRRVVATDRLLNALLQFSDLITDHETRIKSA